MLNGFKKCSFNECLLYDITRIPYIIHIGICKIKTVFDSTFHSTVPSRSFPFQVIVHKIL